MNKKRVKANFLLLTAAAVWGFAFVAQRQGAQYLGAFAFNGIRFLLGGLSLIPLIIFLDSKKEKSERNKNFKYSMLSGIPAGLILFTAASLQQIGISGSTAGKAGFITSLYLVLVPIAGIFLKQKAGLNTWLAVLPAILGLYLLCIDGQVSVNTGDMLILTASVFWMAHILVIDKFSKNSDPLKLSSMQFIICGALSLITSLFTENITGEAVYSALTPILYGGLLSVGIAYTCQVLGQRDAKPSHAALLLSTESVFAAIGGVMLLGETMSKKNIAGCILIFSAIIISQFKFFKRENSQTIEINEEDEELAS